MIYRNGRPSLWSASRLLVFLTHLDWYYKSSHSQLFLKIDVLEIRYIRRKTPVFESLFNKFAGLKACNFIKKRVKHWVFSCEYCKIFKNSIFYRTLLVAASIITIHKKQSIDFYQKIEMVAASALNQFSPVLYFIKKPVTSFTLQIKWLVSVWNTALAWNGLISLKCTLIFFLLRKISSDYNGMENVSCYLHLEIIAWFRF